MEQEIIRLRSQGYGYKAIARMLNTTRDKVRSVCKKNGLGGLLVGLDEQNKETFLLELDRIHPREYELLSEYKGAHTPILVKHVICGDVFEVYPYNLLQKKRCRKCESLAECKNCGALFEKSEERKKYCSDECAEEYYREKYQRSYTLKCETCGKTFQSKHQRKYCSDECRLFKYKAKCLVCGKEFTSTREDARFCSRKHQQEYNKKSHIEFMRELITAHDGMLVPAGIYQSSDSPMEFLCLKCGEKHIKSRARDAVGSKARGCPHCSGCSSKSTGEELIEKWLEKHQIPYEKQFKFDDLRYKNHLLFDFAVLDEEGEVMMLIEFDGQQHFEPIERMGGEEEFKVRQERDRMKEEYARQRGIKLIRIPYFDVDRIDEILEKEII